MSEPRFDPSVWPTAVLFCVRHPLEHQARYESYEGYPVGYPNIFGPPRTGPHCDECGALMYVAGARPWPTKELRLVG